MLTHVFIDQNNPDEGWEFASLRYPLAVMRAHHDLVAEAPAQVSIPAFCSPNKTNRYLGQVRDTTSTLIKSISHKRASFATLDWFGTEEGNYNQNAEKLAQMSLCSWISSNSSKSTEYGSIFIFRNLSSTSSGQEVHEPKIDSRDLLSEVKPASQDNTYLSTYLIWT